MPNIFLRPCNVDDARGYYLKKEPLRYHSSQLYGGFDIYHQTPSITSYDKLDSIFLFDGGLDFSYTNQNGVTRDGHINNWLAISNRGPYMTFSKDNRDSPIFYYLTGHHSEYGNSRLQVCSSPMNILSEDCLDEITVLIPDE